jgi:hypothetical protein
VHVQLLIDSWVASFLAISLRDESATFLDQAI